MGDAFSSADASTKAASDSPLVAVGRIALSYSAVGQPSSDVAELRSDLESGVLADENGTCIGAKIDHAV